ncbi:MAG: hypothetical protein IKI91_00625, partial [Clostridia bacterium]|nr:hypothetical protein [Clostridia bacterium]
YSRGPRHGRRPDCAVDQIRIEKRPLGGVFSRRHAAYIVPPRSSFSYAVLYKRDDRPKKRIALLPFEMCLHKAEYRTAKPYIASHSGISRAAGASFAALRRFFIYGTIFSKKM